MADSALGSIKLGTSCLQPKAIPGSQPLFSPNPVAREVNKKMQLKYCKNEAAVLQSNYPKSNGNGDRFISVKAETHLPFEYLARYTAWI